MQSPKKDFNQSILQAQQQEQDFSITPPLNQEEKERVRELEQEELQEERRLLEESEQEVKDRETAHDQAPYCTQSRFKWMILTLGYVGYSPKAPGTMGSLVGVLLGLPILYYLQASNLILLAILIGAISAKFINEYESQGGAHDDKRIVIDELVGVWIAMAMMGFGVVQALLAFVLFRVFDIWKPSVIGRIDRQVQGGLGVVGDDAVAGFFAGLLGLMLMGLLAQLGVDLFAEIPENAQRIFYHQ